MQYVIYKWFKDTALCGPVNLKATLPCWESEGIIFYEGKPLCFAASENALCHFARDDDGKGLLRGKLIGDIKRRLAKTRRRLPEALGQGLGGQALREVQAQGIRGFLDLEQGVP